MHSPKGMQGPSFKQFIKPSLLQWFLAFVTGKQVANRFFDDAVKCFRLFQCFFEAGDKEICRSIESARIFNKGSLTINSIFNFPWIVLSPCDVEHLAFFLTHSTQKEWKELNLFDCFIQDHGLDILHRVLTNSDVTISELRLDYNGLTKLSSPTMISDITISCKVKELNISNNEFIGENERLYSIVSDPSSVLETLCITHAKLSSI